jgi:prepilin-type N-terminal cleavage/methylation domain-containing protein
MKKSLSKSAYRLPIDFGDEPVFLIPVRKWGLRSGRKKTGRTSFASFGKNNSHPKASPPHACTPGGEGDLNPKISRKSWSSHAWVVNRKSRRAFTLVEILVVLALLSLIVFALMAVFAGTQRAFRASLTQADTLEGGRSVMDLISGDIEGMIPSGGFSNVAPIVKGGNPTYLCPVNFSVNFKTNLYPPSPLYQPLLGSPSGAQRTNILEDIFILSKGNINGVSSWIGTGYSVTTNLADGTLYPLYRFYMTTNASSGAAGQNFIYSEFAKDVRTYTFTNSALWSHLMDGVVNLTVRAYDTNGVWLTNGYANPSFVTVPHNVAFYMTGLDETSCFFLSNAVPASVSFVLGTLEDRVLKHAEALSSVNQGNYLANSAGQVHIFTRRVWIRNLDPTAYQ